LAIEVQKEYAGKSSKVLSQEMVRQMLAPQKANSGLGFALGAPGHKLRFGHGGANAGFRCNLQAYIEGEGIAIMTNSDNGGELSSEVLRAVAKEYSWPDFQSTERAMVKIDPALLPTYAGVYEISGLGNQTVTAKSGKLYLKADPLGPEPQELLPESETRFFLLSQDLTFIFQKDETGTVSKFVIEGKSQTFEARRIP
jgi:hypothetical protein